MKMKHLKGIALAAAAVVGLAACGGSSSSSDTTAAAGGDYSNLKVAVVYIGVPDDKGWTYQHEQGILSLEAELGIEVKRVENVPEGDEAEAIMEGLAAEADQQNAAKVGIGNYANRCTSRHRRNKVARVINYLNLHMPMHNRARMFKCHQAVNCFQYILLAIKRRDCYA